MIFFLLTTVAMAGGECKQAVDLSLASDTSHEVYRIHDHNVAEEATKSRFGLRDHAPLTIDAGRGRWCYNFGSIRLFEEVMGSTGIAVSVDGEVVHVSTHTDYNDFQVVGLTAGQEVRIEFLKPFAAQVQTCDRVVSDRASTLTSEYGRVPYTLYNCAVDTWTWKGIEERLYIVGTDTEAVPWNQQGPSKPIETGGSFGLK